MSTETEVETKPSVDGTVPPVWPPETHLLRKKDLPVKEGSIALCGAKLMGLDLRGTSVQNVCKKCLETRKRECGV